jgi:hypothetical protein
MGLAGVLLPGIGCRVYPLCRAFPRLAYDLEAEALAALLQAVQAWRVGKTEWRPGWYGPPPAAPNGRCAARPRSRHSVVVKLGRCDDCRSGRLPTRPRLVSSCIGSRAGSSQGLGVGSLGTAHRGRP